MITSVIYWVLALGLVVLFLLALGGAMEKDRRRRRIPKGRRRW